MTLIDELVSHPAAPETPPRRNTGRFIAVAAILAMVVAAVWAGAAMTTVGRVSVVFDAAPISCVGSDVGPFETDSAHAFVYTGVVLTPGMQCELRMHVINDGWRDVSVSSVGLPQLGDDSPLKLEATFVSPNGGDRITGDASLNEARFALDGLTIPAGSSELITAAFTYSGGTNLSECSAMHVPSPWAKFSALGMSRTDAPPVHSSMWFSEGPLTDCQPS